MNKSKFYKIIKIKGNLCHKIQQDHNMLHGTEAGSGLYPDITYTYKGIN